MQKQPAITYQFASGAGAASVRQASVATSTTLALQMDTFPFAATNSDAPPYCDSRPTGGEDVDNALCALKQELSNLPHGLNWN